MSDHTILVIEDEAALRRALRIFLDAHGYGVVLAATGREGLELAAREHPDVVILDLGLPDMDGVQVATELRSWSRVPIVVLSARDAEASKVAALDAGADDYVTKPFSPREVVLRIQAILRRGSGDAAGGGPQSFGSGELVIDEDRHLAVVRGEPVELTPTEWGVLLALTRVPGRVYSRYELINQVRGYEFEGYERTVDSHVKNLRRKVERDPRHAVIIETVLGAGYRLGLDRDR